jgi:hypothetical protein
MRRTSRRLRRLLCMGLFSIFLLSSRGRLGPDQKRDRTRLNCCHWGGAPPLSLAGRAGEGVSPQSRLSMWREPPPGASRRPPPQAGEVKRVCGELDLTKRASCSKPPRRRQLVCEAMGPVAFATTTPVVMGPRFPARGLPRLTTSSVAVVAPDDSTGRRPGAYCRFGGPDCAGN